MRSKLIWFAAAQHIQLRAKALEKKTYGDLVYRIHYTSTRSYHFQSGQMLIEDHIHIFIPHLPSYPHPLYNCQLRWWCIYIADITQGVPKTKLLTEFWVLCRETRFLIQSGQMWSKLAQIGPNWPKNWIFLSFLKFTTLDFADFAYSSSFPLCLTAGLTKRPEKNVIVLYCIFYCLKPGD